MRFLVDHCVPREVARWLAEQNHEAWTAFGAGLADAQDEDLLIYASSKQAVLVTTNRDCAHLAQRVRSATVVWLAVREVDALHAMERTVEWLSENKLPSGRVLKVPKHAAPTVLSPKRLT